MNGPGLRDSHCGRARTFDKKTFGRCRRALSDFVLRAYLKPARQSERICNGKEHYLSMVRWGC
jgi:hypothetical protein